MAKTPPTATSGTTTLAPASAQREVETTHPNYLEFVGDWKLLAHVREGTGGFKDGTFLIAHPREWKDYDVASPSIPTKKLEARRKLACYENIAGTILEAKKAALFREVPSRQVGEPKADGAGADAPPSPLEEWWKDVDGAGTGVDDFMPQNWDRSATFGHGWIYMDRPKGAAGTTAADATKPFLRVYPPADVIDWLTDDHGRVVMLKFREPQVRATFADRVDATQLRVVTPEYWAVYRDGALVEGGPVLGRHEMGVLPAVPLYAMRRSLYRHVGQSIFGDPRLYVNLFNLVSEVRELLRNQTFSFINVPLGTGDTAISVEQAKTLLGESIGAMNVIFSATTAQILSGDAANISSYHDEYDRALRTIYRLAGVQWESDSKDAEAKGSLQIKRDDMNARLAGYADELEKADYTLAELFYRAMFGGERGAKAFADAKVRIRYPDTFDLTPFAAVLEQAEAAMSLNFPLLVLKEIRKALLAKFLPDLAPEKLKELEAAIDQAADEVAPMERLRGRVESLMRGKGDPGPDDDETPERKPGEEGAAAA